MLYPLILVAHVFVCFVLIAVILLQAGRGGGLAEAVSGSAQSMFGTRGAAYLTRATTACAVIFMVTSLSLAYLSARKGRSLMEGARLPTPVTAPIDEAVKEGLDEPAPATEQPAEPTPEPASEPAKSE